MKKILLLLFALTFSLVSRCEAGFGTEIGVGFPIGGSGEVYSQKDSYAAFTFDSMFAELIAKENSGALDLTLRLTNTGEDVYTISHPTGQIYDFVIYGTNGNELYRYSDDMAFTDAEAAESYENNKSITYTAHLERRDYKKIKDAAKLITVYIAGVPYTISVLPPTAAVTSRTPATIFGSIIIGNGGWYND